MLRDYADRVGHWFGLRFGRRKPPEDGDAFVRQPVRRGPPSLATGVALAEPAPRSSTNLFGAMLRKSPARD